MGRYALGAIVGLVRVALAIVYFASPSKLQREYTIAAEPITTGTDSATVECGKHLVTSVNGCIGCHGPNLDGTQMIDAPVFATVAASNLTSGRGGIAAKCDRRTPE